MKTNITETEERTLLKLLGQKVIYDKHGRCGVRTSRQGLRGRITGVSLRGPKSFRVTWETGDVQEYTFPALHSFFYWPYAASKDWLDSYILLEDEYPAEYHNGVKERLNTNDQEKSSRVDAVIGWQVTDVEGSTVIDRHLTQKEAEEDAKSCAEANPGDVFQVCAVISRWSTGEARRYPPDPQRT